MVTALKSRKTIYCLTPVKNEEWIIGNFLKAASLWADKIIIADQNSTDKTVLIAKTFPKVQVVSNPNTELDEYSRQLLLINEVRKYPGEKILVALDADEFFTPNFNSPEWNTITSSPKSTTFYLSIDNLTPSLRYRWTFTKHFPLIFVDDGATHHGGLIHHDRLPTSNATNTHELLDIRVMHFQYVDAKRNMAKLKWYQAWEAINHPDRHPIDIFRQYNHHLGRKSMSETPQWWIDEYKRLGVGVTKIRPTANYWWDIAIQNWVKIYGERKFRFYDIWSGQYNKRPDCARNLLLAYLRLTQKYYPNYSIPRFDNLLKRLNV